MTTLSNHSFVYRLPSTKHGQPGETAIYRHNKAFRHVEFLYHTSGKQTLLLAEINHAIHCSE